MENLASSTSMHLIIWQKQLIGTNEREDPKKLQLDPLWDLNMVECHENKSSMCGKLTLEKDKLSLELLKFFLGIQEPTRIERGLKYYWDN